MVEGRVDQRWERAMGAVSQFHSGASDISSRHDEYLDEALGAGS